jgi:hypothetical protein
MDWKNAGHGNGAINAAVSALRAEIQGGWPAEALLNGNRISEAIENLVETCLAQRPPVATADPGETGMFGRPDAETAEEVVQRAVQGLEFCEDASTVILPCSRVERNEEGNGMVAFIDGSTLELLLCEGLGKQ